MLRPPTNLEQRLKDLEKENARLRDVMTILQPPKPIIVWLLASPSGDQFRWFWRVLGHGYFWSDCPGSALWGSSSFKEVCEKFSDDVALALWKIEVEKEMKVKTADYVG